MKKCPKVLLLGNGLNLAYGGISWSNLLKQIARRDDLPLDDLRSPMPLQAILVTNNNIKDALKGTEHQMYGAIQTEEQAEALRRVLRMGFDHILTTNYSYELEMACRKDCSYTKSYLNKISQHTSAVKQVDRKYLLHSYNACTCDGVDNKIWHIHGEARKPDSMILGHYYYASLLCRIKSEVDAKKNEYLENQLAEKDHAIESWMDAFILGDVYILGFCFDLSEFDLWWLLNRKYNENADHGKVYFLEPKSPVLDEKLELLKLLKVEPKHCDIILPRNPGEDGTEAQMQGFKELRAEAYKEFYARALNDLEAMVSADLQV